MRSVWACVSYARCDLTDARTLRLLPARHSRAAKVNGRARRSNGFEIENVENPIHHSSRKRSFSSSPPLRRRRVPRCFQSTTLHGRHGPRMCFCTVFRRPSLVVTAVVLHRFAKLNESCRGVLKISSESGKNRRAYG